MVNFITRKFWIESPRGWPRCLRLLHYRLPTHSGRESLLKLLRRSVDLKRPERARNEGFARPPTICGDSCVVHHVWVDNLFPSWRLSWVVQQSMSLRYESSSKPPVECFRGGLVSRAHKLLYNSTLRSRVIKKKKKVQGARSRAQGSGSGAWSPAEKYKIRFRVSGSRLQVSGFGMRIPCPRSWGLWAPCTLPPAGARLRFIWNVFRSKIFSATMLNTQHNLY